MAEYKCVPVPQNIKIGKKESVESAARLFSDMMNYEANNGWKYHSMETLYVTLPSGCLSFITGSTISMSIILLVFV